MKVRDQVFLSHARMYTVYGGVIFPSEVSMLIDILIQTEKFSGPLVFRYKQSVLEHYIRVPICIRHYSILITSIAYNVS
jgi:hypothetical protein